MYCNKLQRDVPWRQEYIRYSFKYRRILGEEEAVRLMKVQRRLAERLREEHERPRFFIKIMRFLKILRPQFTNKEMADIGCALHWSANDFLVIHREIQALLSSQKSRK